MVITFTTLVVWLIIAALVGIVGEVIARRRTPDGLLERRSSNQAAF